MNKASYVFNFVLMKVNWESQHYFLCWLVATTMNRKVKQFLIGTKNFVAKNRLISRKNGRALTRLSKEDKMTK